MTGNHFPKHEVKVSYNYVLVTDKRENICKHIHGSSHCAVSDTKHSTHNNSRTKGTLTLDVDNNDGVSSIVNDVTSF